MAKLRHFPCQPKYFSIHKMEESNGTEVQDLTSELEKNAIERRERLKGIRARLSAVKTKENGEEEIRLAFFDLNHSKTATNSFIISKFL